ncbi:MAG: hypothetical protein A2675_02715 [Candidatus Yonathbacteria bacterium RIFCSPHIGHO2_01_FULL_51_10]|uniref:Penicillin-binding protein transpeptidase domain-containing protein n=1 Tax=Candidatus Yonathbacteria bacterium RIFCSPHIGHO2_01_FULL_51_10 TaxID=1802723 RepID=A0A1G2S7E1_9BACT|nr:MAG: hypothetical protein A2675_02715 [Candidatus Yonathbacteria bacterium RIFCSPHIGHO2_01_FULL_51_10]
MKSANTLSRFWPILLFFGLVTIIIVGRLFSLQVVNGATYARTAQNQYIHPNSGIFDRGSIFFSDRAGGMVAAATLSSGATLIANGTKLVDAEGAYTALSKIITLEHDAFIEQVASKTDTYIEVTHHLTDDQAAAIKKLALPGFSLEDERWRYYPGGSLAASTVGFVAYNGDDLTGRYGLERYYNDVLSRSGDSSINFFAEVFGQVRDTVFERKPREGNIVTTIEPSVQAALDDSIKNVALQWKPDLVGAIVMNPGNGEIYAMSVMPTFDLNHFGDVEDPAIFENPLVESVREMGSTIKPLVMAAGIDAGVVTPSTTYDDTGSVVINGSTIRNYDGKARGIVSMQEVLNQSLNVGMAFVSKKLGHDNMRSYLLNLGFGEETGIDLPNEIHGLVSNLNSPRDVEYATAAFGQGIAITPIEAVRALAALGNGGLLVDPHLVKEIDYDALPATHMTPNPPERIFKQSTSEAITRMLVKVVDTKLGNGKVALPHYSIAAKTGTAQIALPDGKGYYTDRYLHSFFGYFPAYDPQFIVFFYQVYPKGAQYASETLTTPFMNMAKFLISYYQVPPDR